jgi:hypothetical protein
VGAGDNRIYLTLPLRFSARLQFAVQYYIYTGVQSNVFVVVAWQRLPTADVSLLLCSRIIPGLSYQLLTATDHKHCIAVL